MKKSEPLGTLIRENDGWYLGVVLDRLRSTQPLGINHKPREEVSYGAKLQFAEAIGGPGVIWEIDFPDGYTVTRSNSRSILITGVDACEDEDEGDVAHDLWVTLSWQENEFRLTNVSGCVSPDSDRLAPNQRQLTRTGIVLPRRVRSLYH